MNYIIPFEKTIEFGSQVKEICSISLEHEITKNDTEVLGNFILKGTYKEHELSVNTTDFNFTIPFCVELNKRVDLETLEVSIDNFTYDLDGNNLVVKIDYYVNADELREEIIEDIEPISLIEDLKETNIELNEKNIEETSKVIDERNDLVDPIEITKEIPSIQTDTDYVTYHIHIVKENETMESISMLYKVEPSEIKEINNMETVTLNDKIIIPVKDE